MEFDRSYWGGLIITALLLVGGHFFPWPRRLGKLQAYTYGILAIYAGLLFWLGSGPLFWQMLGFPVVGGLTTLLSYHYDKHRNLTIRARIADVRDE